MKILLSRSQGCPELVFTKPKTICYCFKPIRIQNLRFYPIRAQGLFLINRSGDPCIPGMKDQMQNIVEQSSSVPISQSIRVLKPYLGLNLIDPRSSVDLSSIDVPQLKQLRGCLVFLVHGPRSSLQYFQIFSSINVNKSTFQVWLDFKIFWIGFHLR